MRVISQNERLDFPYENIVVEIMDSVIVAYTPMTTPLRIAQYESQKKAERAMSMLHHTYEESKKFEAINRMISGDTDIPIDRFEDVVSSLCKNLFVFRFPKENEL